jgi:hypothetical protein
MPQLGTVSVTEPVGQAIERVKRVLFRPFDLGKWFTIGFCAWLAHLGESGGTFNYNFGPGHHGRSAREELNRVRDFVMANLGWIVPAAIAVLVIGVAVGVIMIWVSSRGKFMFLHCVALERAEIDAPWYKFAREGNSLFLFRLVLALIGGVLMLPLMAVAVVFVLNMVRQDEVDVHGILALVGVAVVLVAVGIVFFVIAKLTTDFVVPIMFLRGGKCAAAWREFLGLMSANVGRFVVYLLFQIVLCIATGALVLIAIIVTCCLAGCLMILPYVGTVVLLPVVMFKRAYSLHYLAQYGVEYDVFPPVSALPFTPV